VRVDALLEVAEVLGRTDAEARMARGLEVVKVLGLAKGYVDLLYRLLCGNRGGGGGGDDVEPGQAADLCCRDGAGGQAQRVGVEGRRLVEGAFWHCEIDMVYAGDHVCDVRGMGGEIAAQADVGLQIGSSRWSRWAGRHFRR